MALIQWNDNLRLHVPEIDEQHETWIAMLNTMAETIARAASQDGWDARVEEMNAFTTLLEETQAYTHHHFAAEERQMLDTKYPDYKKHKAAHSVFVGMIDEIGKKVAAGEVISSHKLIETLLTWAQKHILSVDQKLAKHLKKSGVAVGG